MKIWKIVGVLVVVVLAIGAFGVGMVFAQSVIPNQGTNPWGNMMGGWMRRAGVQALATPGFGMMGGSGMMGGYGNMMGGAGNRMGGIDMNAMHAWMTGPDGMHTQVLADLAKTLNLTPEALQSQLQSGKSLTQIAQAQGVSQAQLESALEASVKANLANAVAAGRLTQQQADQMLSYMQNNYAQMLQMMGSGMMFGGANGCHDNDDAPAGTGS